MKKGKFIVIEGGDGAGKSTQIRMLKDYFGDLIVTTREPGGTEYAEAIRNLALKHPLAGEADGKTQFMLMWGSRAEHMNHLVIPSLNSGKFVISDRFDSSTFAYNIFAQEENDAVDFFWKTREFILGENLPDLYIYLNVSPEVSRSRMSGRDEKNHFDDRDKTFHEKVKTGFFKFFEKAPHVIIDADGTPEEVFELIKSEIQKHL
jgi:dTMP kinase